MKVEKKKWDGWQLDRPLTVQIAGNVIDITQTARPPSDLSRLIEWLDADSYVDLRSGEIKEAKRTDNRSQSLAEVRRTLKRMRGLINANWFGDNNELLVTLTYAENMTDHKRLSHDLDIFLKRAKRMLGEIKYIAAVEPQGRGAWHAHILVKQMTSHYTYWPAEEVAKIWEHGQIIDVRRLRAVNNVGAYLSAYLTNTPAEDEPAPAAWRGQPRNINQPKRVVKGGRLHLYPRGMHIYRASKNLDKPEVKKMRPSSEELRTLLQGATVTFKSKIILTGTDQDSQSDFYINTIAQMQLNRKSDSSE